MGHPAYVAGIDVGSTKVCAVVADVSRPEAPKILGYGWVQSAGMQRGKVVDLEAVGKALTKTVDAAERASGQKIESAFFSLADEHIQCFNCQGMSTIGPRSRPIGPAHVKRAVESTSRLRLEPGSEVLHFVPRAFSVDGKHQVLNPIGMPARRLEVETHVVTGSTTTIVNTIHAIHRRGLEIDELVVGPLAAAESVLTPEERQAGALLIDVGGGTTDVTIFVDSGVAFTGVIGLGGNQITNDVAIGLKVPLTIAEQVKLQAGVCLRDWVVGDDVVAVPAFDGGEPDHVSARFLADICQARMEEILEAVMDRIAASGFRQALPGGVVITGGGASLPGAVDLTRRLFELPARLGVPSGISGAQPELRNPAMAVAAGLILWGARNGRPEQRGRADVGWSDVTRRLGAWLRLALP